MLHKHGILSNVWLMEEQFASNYLPIVISYLKGNAQPSQSKKEEFFRVALNNSTGYEITEYGYDVTPEDAPQDSIAIIDIFCFDYAGSDVTAHFVCCIHAYKCYVCD